MADTVQILSTLSERYFRDPLGFVQDTWAWGEGSLAGFDGPDKWQTACLTQLGENVSLTEALQLAVRSGHGIGKTTLISWVIIWFMATRPHPQCVVTANTESQLRTKTWRELGKWHRLWLFAPLFGTTATTYYLRDHPATWKANAIAWSENNSEAFAGTHEKHVLQVFDEASKISPAIWEVADGAMSTPGAMWLAFGNPTQNEGRFFDCFHRLRHRWLRHRVDSRDAKMVDKTWAKNLIADWGEDSDYARVRIRGEFPSASELQLIPLSLVEECMNRELSPDSYCKAPRILSMDPARFGDNATCITRRQGLKVWPQKRFYSVDDMVKVGLMVDEIREFKPHGIFIDSGYGGGVIDRLRQLGYTVYEVVFGGGSSDPRHANKRTQIWFRLKEWMEAGGSLPKDDDLKADLICPQRGWNAKDQNMLESKEQIKKRLGASPDYADSLAIGFAEHIALEEDDDLINEETFQGNDRTDYNPYANLGG